MFAHPLKALQVMFACVALVSTIALAEGMNRDQAFEALKDFKKIQEDFRSNQLKALAEAKTAEEKADLVNAFRNMPTPHDFEDEANFVINADATDEKAFVALRFIRRGIGISAVNYDRSLELLLKHHIKNKDIVDAIGTPKNLTFGEQVAIWDQIIAQNPHPDAQAHALLETVNVFSFVASQPMSMDERKLLVEQAEIRAARIERDFPEATYHSRGFEISFADQAKKEVNVARSLLGAQLADFVDVVNLEGEVDKLSNYRGKYVLLDFWATWCGPCVAGMPSLIKLSEELEGEPFQVIGVSLDSDIDTILDFQDERQPMPWVNWHMGPDHPAADELNIKGIPLYILVDPEGKIVSRSHSFDDDSKAKLKEMVKSISG